MSYRKAIRTNYLCTMKTIYFSLCFMLLSISGFAKTENAIYPYNSIEHTTDILASTDTSSCDCLKDSISTNSKGQTRKINKTSVANIVKFLLKK